MNKRLVNLCCCLTADMEKRTKDGCYKAYFLEGFIGETVRRMNTILNEQDTYIEELERRIVALESQVKGKR